MAFKHRPLTREQLERRTDQKSQIIDPAINPQFLVFRPKVGLNTIRFLPPTWDNYQHWAYDIFLHRNTGPDNGSYLCLRKMLREPCPVCEEVAALDHEGDTEAGKQLFARKSRVAWIMDRADQEKGPQIWIYGWTIDEDIATRCFDRKTGAAVDILDPDNGYDVSFRRGNEKPFPKTSGIEVDRSPSPLDDDQAWQDHWLSFVQKHPVPDTLIFYDYDHIYRVLNGSTRKPSHSEEVDTRSTGRRPPPPDDEPGDQRETQPAERRRPAPDPEPAQVSRDGSKTWEEPRREREPEPEAAPAGRRRAPPEDEQEAPRTTGQTRRPPPDDDRREPPREAAEVRRRPPPEDEPAEREPRGNGHDTPTTQARRQLDNLREEDQQREAAPAGRRRMPPPEDDTQPARRRPPPR